MVSSDVASGAFVYFDGDDVGARIELHLLRNEVAASAALSTAVVRAVGDMADHIRTRMDGHVVFAAGDEVLAFIPDTPGLESIEGLRNLFRETTGLTISCGVGVTAAEAARSLHLAKLLGKDRVCEGTMK